jgi:hypothetical protein
MFESAIYKINTVDPDAWHSMPIDSTGINHVT